VEELRQQIEEQKLLEEYWKNEQKKNKEKEVEKKKNEAERKRKNAQRESKRQTSRIDPKRRKTLGPWNAVVTDRDTKTYKAQVWKGEL
jgi:hypothetical protein